ncbi:hypothetical protein B4N89_46645 [Embleya scabrispora]|uniref:Uncharacterized protein n=1 Tax=Embleya scabrispora TaxID=159449 RepID=A0A1T3NI50_9ACTN|nr:hypothetical protein B4N89_46645 [Embleya scabrispora]
MGGTGAVCRKSPVEALSARAGPALAPVDTAGRPGADPELVKYLHDDRRSRERLGLPRPAESEEACYVGRTTAVWVNATPRSPSRRRS